LRCLKKNGVMSRSEVAEKIKANPCSTSELLRKLIKSGDIKFKEINRIEAERRYGVKRRMRIFYV